MSNETKKWIEKWNPGLRRQWPERCCQTCRHGETDNDWDDSGYYCTISPKSDCMLHWRFWLDVCDNWKPRE
jgi:hypothetical protein